jgi:hydrogenase-4 component B
MMLTGALLCAAALLALAVLAVLLVRSPHASRLVYTACMIVTATALAAALTHLLAGRSPEALTLPIGLPWLGAHFRLDALSAFFLVVVELGAMIASLFALGYGKHERAPERVVPFFPAFLAAMALVVLADDAFTFLLSWEFMSLTSWALVISHHRAAENVRAGYIYLLMASFGTLALLLGFGLLAGPDGLYTFAQMRAVHPAAATAALVLLLTLIGTSGFRSLTRLLRAMCRL